MHDDQIRGLLRTLEDDRTPDPAFADALYRRLHMVAGDRRPSRTPMLLLAAALTIIVAAGIAVGSGLIKPPETVTVSATPMASTSGLAVASPSATPNASEDPSSSAPASASPDTGDPAEMVLFAEADGLRIRSEPSESGDVVTTLRRGQLMGATGERAEADGISWYQVRIGPGDLAGWVSAGRDGERLRRVVDGAVAFVCEGGCGDASLVSVQPSGNGALTGIAEEPYREWTWSPDGTRIAATSDDGGAKPAEIVVMDTDGSNLRTLGLGYGPAWSPDGTRLAWSTGATLVVTDDSLAPTELDLDLLSAGNPMWAPDGLSLAFGAIDCPECPVDEPIVGDPPSATWIVGIDGSGLRQITGGDYSGLADWSPDGTTLAFVQHDLSGEFPTRAYTIPVAGGERTYLEDGGAILGGPSWSPDGRFLLYATPEDIVITAGDGSSSRTLLGPNLLADSLAWSPSGQWILSHGSAIIDQVEQPGVMIQPVDGSAEAVQISPRTAFVRSEAWQPVLAPLP